MTRKRFVAFDPTDVRTLFRGTRGTRGYGVGMRPLQNEEVAVEADEPSSVRSLMRGTRGTSGPVVI